MSPKTLGARMYPGGGAAWRRVLIPTSGALITGYLLSRFFPNARGSGIPQTKAALFLRDGYISLRTVLGKFGCCSASLASGIALGREGPSVQVGAGIASVLGRRLGLGPSRIRELIPVGAAAALAAAFNTPVAAVLFTLEEVMGDLHAPVLGSIVLGSATSWVTLHLLLGDEPLFHVPSYQLVSPIEFITYALLGTRGRTLSRWRSSSCCWRSANICSAHAEAPAEWLAAGERAASQSDLMGWFVPDVLGVGYGHVSEALNGQLTLQVMALLVVLKAARRPPAATAPGTRAASSAPALFIGAMLGGAVGTVAHQSSTRLHGRRRRVCVGRHGRAIRRHRARAADVGDHDLRDDARLFHHRAAHDREPDQLLHLASPAKRAHIRSAPAPGWDYVCRRGCATGKGC
jgi:CIC family chloride channel protein